MHYNIPFERSVPGGGRPVKQIHLDARRFTIISRSEVGVVDTRSILSVREHRVTIHAAAPQVVLLKIAGLLCKAQVIQPVMHEVAPIEELDDRGCGIIGGSLRKIHRQIKRAERISKRPWQIGQIVRVPVRMSIDVIPAGVVGVIIYPAQRRCVARNGRKHLQSSGNDWRLVRAWMRQAGAHRGRTP